MANRLFTADNYKTYFSWQKFHELSSEQRKDLIDFSVKQISKEKGLHSVDLEFRDMNPGSRGSCTPQLGVLNHLKGHKMVLNSDVLTSNSRTAPYSIYNTINHELEHANQYERASDRSIGNDDAATLEQRLNDEHYYSASGDKVVYHDGARYRTVRFDDETDYQLYRAQACEADARAAGLKAVEELKESNASHGIHDEDIENYIEYAKANEVTNNRDMMERLGMHSRENMAREELNHISEKRVSPEDREKVIAYARQKDYEVANEVLLDDANGNLTEDQIRLKFDSDNEYNDFYQTDTYQANKVVDSERQLYKYSKYKWESDDVSLDDSSNEQRDQFRKSIESQPRSQTSAEQQRSQFRERFAKETSNRSNYEIQREKFTQAANGERQSEELVSGQSKGAEYKVDR